MYSGGAGTGESALIKGFRYEANCLLSTMAESSKNILVSLVVYTGTAAFKIDGQTIHSALAIQCDIRSRKYTPPGEDQLTDYNKVQKPQNHHYYFNSVGVKVKVI